MMADLTLVVGEPGEPVPAWAFSRSMSARVRPAPKAPIWRKLRRCRPSQNTWRRPRKASMDESSGRGKQGGWAIRQHLHHNSPAGGGQWKSRVRSCGGWAADTWVENGWGVSIGWRGEGKPPSFRPGVRTMSAASRSTGADETREQRIQEILKQVRPVVEARVRELVERAVDVSEAEEFGAIDLEFRDAGLDLANVVRQAGLASRKKRGTSGAA